MKIKVGDRSINWRTLPPQFDHKEVRLVEGESVQSVGTVFEEITLTNAAHQPALHRLQQLQSDMLGDRTTESVVFRETFRPHSHHDITEAHEISIVYQDRKVIGRKQHPGGEPLSIEDDLDTSVFDAHSVELLLRLLPLKNGYMAQIPIYHAVQQMQMTVTVRVIGRETVTDSKGSVASWQVHTDWNGRTQYYWIGIDQPELVKQSVLIREGVLLEFVRM